MLELMRARHQCGNSITQYCDRIDAFVGFDKHLWNDPVSMGRLPIGEMCRGYMTPTILCGLPLPRTLVHVHPMSIPSL